MVSRQCVSAAELRKVFGNPDLLVDLISVVAATISFLALSDFQSLSQSLLPKSWLFLLTSLSLSFYSFSLHLLCLIAYALSRSPSPRSLFSFYPSPFFICISESRGPWLQLRRPCVCGVLLGGFILRALHRHTAGIRTDLCGAATAGQTHCSVTQTRPARRHCRETEEGTFVCVCVRGCPKGEICNCCERHTHRADNTGLITLWNKLCCLRSLLWKTSFCLKTGLPSLIIDTTSKPTHTYHKCKHRNIS